MYALAVDESITRRNDSSLYIHNRTITTVEKSKTLVVLDDDAFSNMFHDGSENIDEDDVSDESADVAEEDWAGLD